MWIQKLIKSSKHSELWAPQYEVRPEQLIRIYDYKTVRIHFPSENQEAYHNKAINLVLITKKKKWESERKNFKLLGKLRTEENFLSLINDISEKPTANIILMVSDWMTFLLRSKQGKNICSHHFIQCYTKSPTNKVVEYTKSIQIWKGEKLSLPQITGCICRKF